MFDFEIDPSHEEPSINPDAPSSAITLNQDIFYPSGPSLGWTPFTGHTARPVPWSRTIDQYIARPDKYDDADLVAIVDHIPVPNEHGWNLTCVMLTTFAYGTERGNTFENHWENISAIEVFLAKTNISDDSSDKDMELRDVKPAQEKWTLEWWQIVPLEMLHKGATLTNNHTAVEMPNGLRDKLLGTAQSLPLSPTARLQNMSLWTRVTVGPWNAFQVWMCMCVVMAVVLGFVYLLAATGTALLGSDRVARLPRWVTIRQSRRMEDGVVVVDEETSRSLKQAGVVSP